ncbi:MAG: LptF/LptG family permease [bacterium]|nr:LptF/LptG family permease [bacterium]
MSTLSRFIVGRFLRILLFSLLAAVLVFLVIDLIENLDKFLDRNVATNIIARYYLLFLPYIAFLVFPVAMILATLSTIGGLINTHELVAMRASGISLWWVSSRLIIVGVFVSGFLFWFGEYLLPPLNQQRMEIWRVEVKKLPKQSTVRSDRIYLLEGAGRFFHMEHWDETKQRGLRPTLQLAKGRSVYYRIDAEEAKWDSASGWQFERGVERKWENEKETVIPFKTMIVKEVELTPIAFADLSVKPEEMGYTDLKRFIKRLDETGSKTTRWNVELSSKLATAASALIIVLIGVPIAAVQRRSGVVLSFGMGLFVSFLYFGMIQIAKIFGFQGDIPAWFAAWFANGTFAILGFFMLLRVRK